MNLLEKDILFIHGSESSTKTQARANSLCNLSGLLTLPHSSTAVLMLVFVTIKQLVMNHKKSRLGKYLPDFTFRI
jgi:hypothetical protein